MVVLKKRQPLDESVKDLKCPVLLLQRRAFRFLKVISLFFPAATPAQNFAQKRIR